ncbi:MAG: hypothetical protein OEM06_12745 [Desulfobacteraceae bacterium]|nr:hypothetical protein [Desulfobacteraceae bacterium]MDH3573612.1 hypothetical protein [Desulfobacteraceae bacterium]MDH3837806.1 hypothetical protein [Desulfobacteraceae bacterium]MDH3874493.1 hypothetical protein [Desulfobacteraceae bacterium]
MRRHNQADEPDGKNYAVLRKRLCRFRVHLARWLSATVTRQYRIW